MKIALIGYGKVGKLIEELALQQPQEYEIVAIIDPKVKTCLISQENLKGAEVCIDFTKGSSFLENLKILSSFSQTVVAGTTGWYDEMDQVKELVKKGNMGFLYSPNFSIGVNIFLKIVKEAASLIAPFDEYDISGFEVHHKEKKDSPSGTALLMSSLIMGKLDRKKKLVTELKDEKIPNDALHIASLRSGSNAGLHTVIMDSEDDMITLSHQAKNRRGFAKGALLASKWLLGKKGFYTIDDFLGSCFHD